MIDITDRFKKYGDYIGGIMKDMGSPAEDEKESDDEKETCVECGCYLENNSELFHGLCERCYEAAWEQDKDDYRHPDARA